MQFNLVPFLAVEVLLVAVVIALIVWRKTVASGEDDSLHMFQANIPSQQSLLAQKLEVIDKWGKIATVVTVVFGVLLTAVWVYQIWITSSRIAE